MWCIKLQYNNTEEQTHDVTSILEWLHERIYIRKILQYDQTVFPLFCSFLKPSISKHLFTKIFLRRWIYVYDFLCNNQALQIKIFINPFFLYLFFSSFVLHCFALFKCKNCSDQIKTMIKLKPTVAKFIFIDLCSITEPSVKSSLQTGLLRIWIKYCHNIC